MKLFARFLLAALMGAAASISFAADDPEAKPAAAAAPAKVAKPDPAKGDTIFNNTPANSQSCASCHNADGNSAIAANPKLAQQHPEYILKQLQDFKSGKRKSAIMKPLASALSEEDMRNVAWFVGSKKVKPGFAKEKDLVALGEKIYRGGIGERQIPACAGCHSPNGAGIPAQYPRLGGQHADYTSVQLNQFRDGTRQNSPQMTGVAAKLNDREIKAVADYIAGLR
ncbi:MULTISPECIES: c-type cytochrome [unclassified Variovorax]|uniref:c-type cytochrome n=1 Tax=unclassified Variovorax TaxID=663243 RepID=UPI00076D6A14|nr:MULTISPECIES: c-type cytochrome [unclassified Variovorax]KWT97390.1 Cytochrome c4 [Variovorax sp. WDL1]PNG60062.1 Cytochrome c4 [Variovorax sp. B4]PNG60145.1 Cytochrome c4 [Variovorax sp. B2]VTV14035.1 Cytochrome c4 precursor [Variovorax sp. WDL1]